jgi:hypothetical protein
VEIALPVQHDVQQVMGAYGRSERVSGAAFFTVAEIYVHKTLHIIFNIFHIY